MTGRLVQHVATVARDATTVDELVAELRTAEQMIGELRATLVAEMVRVGWSWQMIGDTLGCSRQAARERYGH